MTSRDERIRIAIAEQASEWFVANDESALGAEDAAALVAWFRASPANVKEFLDVTAVARDLHALGTDPDYSVDALVARARADTDIPVRSLASRTSAHTNELPVPRWRFAAVTLAAVLVASLGWLLWDLRLNTPSGAIAEGAALQFQTRHGEQRSFHLPDKSVLHLNTDSAVTVRYGDTERLVVLNSGEAAFDVAHEAKRTFRVLAGTVEIVDRGTSFNVRLNADSTVVTVVEGQVAVVPTPGRRDPQRPVFLIPDQHVRAIEGVLLIANQQVSVTEGQWPVTPSPVDGQRVTAWLHRQIVFDHEPLERVAAEINRYSLKPITIADPALRNLEVSGIFSTDDAEEFVAFLRSLENVRVEVTATEIRVSQK